MRQLDQRRRLLQTAARGAADDGDHEATSQLGVPLDEHGRRSHEDVGGLERLHPTREQHDEGVLRQHQPRPRDVDRARPEPVQVDAGVHDLDPARVGVVEIDELLGLDVGVRDEDVSGLDHLLLTDHPHPWLGGVAGGERLVLDLRHGVHAVHQRHTPPITRQRPDLTREPVVGVDDVVVAVRLRSLGAQHLTREHAQLSGQLLLGQPLERPGGHVPHDHTVVERDDGRQPRARGTRKHVDLDALACQAPGQLDDVDVQAAGVAGARLVERGGVQADHRDATRLLPLGLAHVHTTTLPGA